MRRAELGVHALLVAAVALLLQTVYLQRRNTLEDNGHWRSSKVGLQYGILGAVAFLTTRTALWHNHLDLSDWHGYQEVVRREPLRLGRLEARVRIAGAGYVVVLFEKTAHRFQGVRLSTDRAFPAACLAGDTDGGFSSKIPLDVPLLDDDWHNVELRRSGATYRVSVDGRDVGPCGVAGREPAWVGFRGSLADHTWVDDVGLWSVEPGPGWFEDFSNRRHAAGVLALAAALVLGVGGLVLLVSGPARRRQGLSAGPYLLTVDLVLLISAAGLWAVDSFVLWPRHPEDVDFRGYETTFERKSDVEARLRRQVGPKSPARTRLLFLGGSQTWGSGARTRADTWFAKLQSALGDGVEIVDGGIPAYTAPQLLELYEDEWIHLQPDVLVLNVGYNDRDTPAFVAAVRRFVALDRKHGIRTVLIPEASSVENRGSDLDGLRERHQALRRIAREENLPIVETHEWLAQRRDSGFLWWDRVHLTPYGQTLLARRLYEQRDRLLGR